MSDNVSSWLNFAQRSRDDGGLGLEPHQASGLVGNLVQESGPSLNPWGPTGDNGTAWGTAQWRGDRLAGLQKYASENGLDHRSIEAQQGWMRKEFDGPENASYQALQAARTPEEAATAVNRRYERSADNSGQREANARQLMMQFGGQPALSSALAYNNPTGAKVATQDDAPALSAAAQVGPGILVPGVSGNPAQTQGYDWRSRLSNFAAALSSASDPEQAKVLLAQAQAPNKDTGSYSLGPIDPQTGVGLRIHNKTGQVTTFQAQKPKDPAGDAYDLATAKGFADTNAKIAADAQSSQAALSNVDTLRGYLSNPDVMQGSNAESVNNLKRFGNTYLGMDFKGVSDADAAVALMNKMTQESRTLNGGMPGSLSDKDMAFLKAANPSLDKSPEANQHILDIYEKLHKANIQRNADRLEYTQNGAKPLDEGFNVAQAKKWADRKAALDATDNATPPTRTAAPAAAPRQIKTSSGKTINWSYNP